MGDSRNIDEKLNAFIQQIQEHNARSDARLAKLEDMFQQFMRTQQRSPTVGTRNSKPCPTDLEEVHFKRRTAIPMVSTYSKLEFPSYDGLGDSLGWLHCCEQFFVNQHTEEADKVSLPVFRLTG